MQVNGVSHHGIVDQRDPERSPYFSSTGAASENLIPLNDRQTFPCGRLNAVLWYGQVHAVRILKAAFQIRVRENLSSVFRRPIPGSFNFGETLIACISPVGYPFLTQDDFAYPAFRPSGMIHTGHAAVIHGRGGCPASGRSAPSIDIISPLLSMPPIGCGPFLPYHVPFPPYPYLPCQQRTGIEGGNGST